ncbi:MAG: NFACT family protein [Candidatus Micrarchaeota archaeon]
MRSLTSLEYSYLVENEFKKLIGKHFSKVQRISETKLRFKIGDTDLIFECGIRIHQTKYMEEVEEPTGLELLLKKYLDNAKLLDVYQHNKDRIIAFNFQAGKEKCSLVFEMFGKGNMILVQNDLTLAALKEETWSDRVIKKAEEYKFPKSNVIDNLDDAIENNKEKYIVIALLKLPLGKEYALDILERCKIEQKSPCATIGKSDIEKLKNEIQKLILEQKPVGFYKDNKINDFGLTSFSKYADLEAREFSKLSEAADEHYWSNKEEKNHKLDKIERRLEEQMKKLEELAVEEKEHKERGDYIYANYQQIEEILKIAKTAKLEELEQKLEKLKAKVDKKEKTIEIEI